MSALRFKSMSPVVEIEMNVIVSHRVSFLLVLRMIFRQMSKLRDKNAQMGFSYDLCAVVKRWSGFWSYYSLSLFYSLSFFSSVCVRVFTYAHTVFSFVNPLLHFVPRPVEYSWWRDWRLLFLPLWFYPVRYGGIYLLFLFLWNIHSYFCCGLKPNGALSWGEMMVTFARNSLVKKLKYITHIHSAHLV